MESAAPQRQVQLCFGWMPVVECEMIPAEGPMALEVTQVDCRSCGAKLDIHTGLRARTFVCEYCGAICDHEKVVALQDLQEMKSKYAPWSHLRLGMKGRFLGQEYQIIGRVRSTEKNWWWDEWLLYAETGFPLWLQEGEGGFKIYRVFYPTVPMNVRGAKGAIKLDKNGGTAKIRERGMGTIAFIEGELTWAAAPGEQFEYLEASRGRVLYSVEYSASEFQFLRGEARFAEQVYERFGITDPVPAPLTFDDESDESVESESMAGTRYRCPTCSKHLKSAKGLQQHARAKHSVSIDAATLPMYAVVASGGGVGRGGPGSGWPPPDHDPSSGGGEDLKVSRGFGASKVLRSWIYVIAAAVFALAVGVYGLTLSGKAKYHTSYSFKASAGTGPGGGVLLTDKQGRPVAVKLPKSRGIYELRMASSALPRSGRAGGHCWWGQLDFLKAHKRCDLNKVAYQDLAAEDLLPGILGRISRKHNISSTFNWSKYIELQPSCNEVTVRIRHNFAKEIGFAREVAAQAKNPPVKLIAVDVAKGTARFSVSAAVMKKLHDSIDPWKRFAVVHRVSAWFGRYWGVNDGKWNENTYLQQHFFSTKDRGPYYLRVYSGNCKGYASTRKYNTVYGPTMTVAIYTDATDATPIWIGVGVLLLFLFIYVMVKANYFFSGD
jgi:predicted RNA-binding Zn-ribbon protein involved in translation (DUF1610 family)